MLSETQFMDLVETRLQMQCADCGHPLRMDAALQDGNDLVCDGCLEWRMYGPSPAEAREMKADQRLSERLGK